MRIAVSTDDGEIVAGHFGRCESFLIFDATEGQTALVERRPNRHTGHALGQCGQHAADGQHAHHSHAGILSALHDCQAVITGGMGWRAAADLEANGVSAFVTIVPCGAGQAVSLLLAGLLKPAAETACRGHQHP